MFPIFAGNSASTGYNLTRSLRFRRSATAYLNRTPSVAGNRQKFTISVWYKAGGISASEVNANILNAGGDGSSVLISGTGAFGGTYQDRLLYREGGTTLLYWPMVFRDPASWYHIVFAMDTTQATAANRTKLYVNGVDQGAFSGTAITQNASTSINNTSAHYINTYNGTFYPSDLYYTEYNFIDGQQLTPASFGSTNALTGVWQPARYTGTYGTNGFYLPFTDNSGATSTTIGKDFSGNSNNWTPNNISITAGVTYDSMTDVPTLTSATASNFAVLNPIGVPYNTGTASGGNLNWTGASTADKGMAGTIAMSSGKWYWECVITATSAASNNYVGIVKTAGSADSNANRVYLRGDGLLVKYGSTTTGYTTFTTGDIIGVAYDYSAQTLSFYKNNTLNVTVTGINLESNLPWVGGYNTTESWSVNFGQRPFSYTPPTGYVALNTFNLPTSTILKGNTVMDATLYTGTLLSNAITNAASFKPDLVWVKSRSAATSNKLTDSVRGVTKGLVSNTTAAETTDTQGLTAFGSAGFTVGTDTNYNNLAATYVGWQWQAGQGSSASNTNGTITSTVSVNASAGFSVVTWTGTGANATIGHGLGVAPQFIINKPRNAADNWPTWHTSLGALGYVYINLTNASVSLAAMWNSTLPTSSVFSVGTSSNINTSAQTMVSYCWTPIAGFSAFGSYTGNGSTDGPMIYTGFLPRWITIKRTDTAGDWYTIDTARNPYNYSNLFLFPNSSSAESAGTITWMDILSNGFKLRNTGINASGGTYIYMAFAENPTKYALAR